MRVRRVLFVTDVEAMYNRAAVNGKRFGQFFLISDFKRHIYDFDKNHENLLYKESRDIKHAHVRRFKFTQLVSARVYSVHIHKAKSCIL